jgi:uncharacterized phiE125 gp8 family phage protein
MTLEVTSAPTGAVSLDDAIAHLRLIEPAYGEPLPDEDLVELYMIAAEEKIEGRTGWALSERGLRLTLDVFPRCIVIPVAPVIAVSAVKYLDRNGDQQTVADTVYTLLDKAGTPRIVLKPDQSWPETWEIGGAVSVEFTAGHADPEDIPGALRTAVLQTVAGMYAYREDVAAAQVAELPNGVWSLIADYVRWEAFDHA